MESALQITVKEFQQRRKKLMAHMSENSIAILPAAPVAIRNRDVEYPYRQDSDFYYLSGFIEPEAVMVLKPKREHGEFIMFCRERDPEKEMWGGLIKGPEGLCEEFGADDAFPIQDIDEILPGLIEGCDKVYYSMGSNPEFDRRVMSWVNVIRSKVRSGAQPPNEFMVLDHILHDLRLIKSKREIQLIRRAGEISAQAHVLAMKACQPGMWEYQLEGVYLNHFQHHGCRSAAYPSIVGGGANGCILHYVENADLLKADELVLVDAGCEHQYYAGDITRTFPVDGQFSPEQRAIYEIVLQAQLDAIEQIKPGNHWDQPHEASVRTITRGLIKLGLLKGTLKTLIKAEAYKPFYMHRTGHWLGLDVHDVGDYKVGGQWRLLEPGMTLTVEPGIYISPDNTSVAKQWRGIGIRIEDNVLVTKTGCELLTDAAPTDPDEIERLMAS